VTVLNDVAYTQVCFTLADDTATERVGEALMADGTTWITGSRWHGRAVLRVSVSGWRTTEDDVARSVEAVRAAVALA
jgi:glutamate/tyrosine decarboxylase-like PLP-dependent enzyme